mgnify:CR=1 FL=1
MCCFLVVFFFGESSVSISYAVTTLDKQNRSLPTSEKILVKHNYVLDFVF